MKRILDLIADEMKSAFTACGYDASYAKVVLSNRPDLCEYQCNGALAAAEAGVADDVIEPAATRQMIAAALEMLLGKREVLLPRKHGNLPL